MKDYNAKVKFEMNDCRKSVTAIILIDSSRSRPVSAFTASVAEDI